MLSDENPLKHDPKPSARRVKASFAYTQWWLGLTMMCWHGQGAGPSFWDQKFRAGTRLAFSSTCELSNPSCQTIKCANYPTGLPICLIVPRPFQNDQNSTLVDKNCLNDVLFAFIYMQQPCTMTTGSVCKIRQFLVCLELKFP